MIEQLDESGVTSVSVQTPPLLKLPRFVLLQVTVPPGKMFALPGASVTVTVHVLGAFTSRAWEQAKFVVLPSGTEESS